MTLIAAYKEFEVPILLGDVLITGDNSESHCKKINKISDNFVIGWTGRKLNAVAVLKRLFEDFASKPVTIRELTDFLLNFDTSDFLGDEFENKLIMTGWIIDDKAYCFRWNSDYNQQLFFDSGDGFFDGSGSPFYEELRKEKARFSDQSPRLTPYLKAAVSVLKEVCALTNAEYLSLDKSWRNGFGFAYEVMLYDGKTFDYLNNVLYFSLNIHTTSDWQILKYEVLPYILKYRTFGNLSLFQISKNVETRNETHQFFVGRGFDDDVENQLDYFGIIGTGSVLLPDSDYYCMTRRISNGDRCIDGMMTIIGQNNDLFKVNHKNGVAIFSFGPKFHQLVYDSIALNKEYF